MFKAVIVVLASLSFVFGVFGFMQVPDYSFGDACYSVALLYMVNGNPIAPNIWVEISRWLAVGCFSGALFWIFRNIACIGTRYKNLLISRFKNDFCAIYGSSVYAKQLANKMRDCACIQHDELLPAATRHIIMFDSDKENLDFYLKNKDELANKKVYILLEEIHAQSVKDPNVTVFGMNENAARLFWEHNPVICNRKIGIIGFGYLGEDILTFGLCKNIFSPVQNIEYHIWGDSEKFRKTHTKRDKIDMDKIIFHSADWADDIASEKFAELDMIILCDKPDDNIKILSNMLIYATLKEKVEIFVYSPSSETITKLFDDKAKAFGTTEELSKEEVILKGELLNNAKALHANYKSQYPSMDAWEELDNFKRYSNISAADFFLTLKLLHNEGKSIEFLPELEHIRWCRYHYLNNWDYEEKIKDADKKRHYCLVPFIKLSEEDKKKDRENVEIALGLNSNFRE